MKIMMQKQIQPNNKDTHTKTPSLLVNEDYDAKTNSTQHLLEWVGLLFFSCTLSTVIPTMFYVLGKSPSAWPGPLLFW
jgi:hypothetical protein